MMQDVEPCLGESAMRQEVYQTIVRGKFRRVLQNSIYSFFNRPNGREIKFVLKLNKINFYNNFIYNFDKFPARRAVIPSRR